ncbi:hypothetical protein GOP47_0000304 [Adiantum capillus-veneris]|uniref:Uncharacterized protein n=1 Tax=Adiantum capillus-veneris TaxID=13818 RepID=A0A9D4VCS6_ADICA|nr:hypothetical protein GOP47_0000304 [Adiantum capillus-veneris]
MAAWVLGGGKPEDVRLQFPILASQGGGGVDCGATYFGIGSATRLSQREHFLACCLPLPSPSLLDYHTSTSPEAKYPAGATAALMGRWNISNSEFVKSAREFQTSKRRASHYKSGGYIFTIVDVSIAQARLQLDNTTSLIQPLSVGLHNWITFVHDYQ